MHTVLAAFLALADALLSLFFGVFAIAMLCVAIQMWQSRDGWKVRLAAVFFFGVLLAASVQLAADAYRHLGEFVALLYLQLAKG